MIKNALLGGIDNVNGTTIDADDVNDTNDAMIQLTASSLSVAGLNVIRQSYMLRPAWDISTAVFTRSFDVSAKETTPCDVFFKSDGIEMYIIGYDSDNVHQYTLSTAWNISTASFTRSFDVSAKDTAPTGVFFKSDGTEMYIIGSDSDAVHQYTLSKGNLPSSAGGFDLFFDAYTASKGREDTVDLANTTAIFDYTELKYTTDGTTETEIYHTIPADSFGENVDGFFCVPLIEDWEDGANIQFKVLSANEDTGWLDCFTGTTLPLKPKIHAVTPFTAEPDELIIKLVPKTTSPTASYPSVKGVALKCWEN
jgi:hypothetical protein